ncbi:hypothetical protein [Clostridium isatidis]|uniref:hypothetical protein n=1 Tax=Clostridium isatidis TaxID=182773 RepID=UPI003AB095BC
MFKVNFIEMFIRAIPEQTLLVIGSYILSRTKLNVKKALLSGIIMGVSLYIFRLLPVQFGFHTLFAILLLAFLNYKVNKINLIKSIEVSSLNYILLFASETFLALILQSIFKVNLDMVFQNPIRKTLLGIPSLIIFVIFIYLIDRIQKIHKKKIY